MRLPALALLVAPCAARAEGWRVDLDGAGGDALPLIVAILCGLAFFHIRSAYARSSAEGDGTVAIVFILAVVLLAFPPARAVAALVAAGFLVYGFFRAA